MNRSIEPANNYARPIDRLMAMDTPRRSGNRGGAQAEET